MAISGEGTFGFNISTSIPQVQTDGDDRYTRPFKKNEGIIIRLPLNSDIMADSEGIYKGIPFTLSANEREIKANLLPYGGSPGAIEQWPLPTDLAYAKHDPDICITTDGLIYDCQSIVFANENDGKIYLNRFVDVNVEYIDTFVGSKLSHIPQNLNAVNISLEQRYSSGYGVTPYLWGSVIEGVRSGARRFIIGPTSLYTSNPSFGNYCDTNIDSMSTYGDMACSGTGPYNPGTLKYIMPFYRKDGLEIRNNLFNYQVDSKVDLSNPINNEFLKSTPFAHQNLDYSGFRLKNRKSLPVPYSEYDQSTVDLGASSGVGVLPEDDVFFGANKIFPWISVATSRSKGYAITKRHVLGTLNPFHSYAYYKGEPSAINPIGYANSITGQSPFTDTNFPKKIHFWDKINRTIIEREIVASKPIDVKTIHETIREMLKGNLLELDSYFSCSTSNPLGQTPITQDPCEDCEGCFVQTKGFDWYDFIHLNDVLINDVQNPVGKCKKKVQSTSKGSRKSYPIGFKNQEVKKSNKLISSDIPPLDEDSSLPNNTLEGALNGVPSAAINAISEFFPHGLNNIFYGYFNTNDDTKNSCTWQYIVSHFKAILDAKCVIHLLDQDLPDGVVPIAFLDTRRSETHKFSMFLDNSDRGFILNRCNPKPSVFAHNVSQYGPYAVEASISTYQNPLKSSMITFNMTRIGNCDNVYPDGFLDSCDEPNGSTSGPKCRWRVYGINCGAAPLKPGIRSGLDTNNNYEPHGIFDAETTKRNPCFVCDGETVNNTTSKIPDGSLRDDILLDFSLGNDYNLSKGLGQSFRPKGSSDIPAPLFTYNESGIPIMSDMIMNSKFTSALKTSNGTCALTCLVTGHNEDFEWSRGTEVWQNFDGTIGGGDSWAIPQPKWKVYKHSKDNGVLTLYAPRETPGNLILPTEVLVGGNSCNNTIFGFYGGTGYIKTVLESLANPCSNPTTYGVRHQIGGKKGYIYDSSGKYLEVIRGGSRFFTGISYLLQRNVSRVIEETSELPFARNLDCSSTKAISSLFTHELSEGFDQNLGEHWEQSYKYHNIGSFLSDQKIYYRANPSDQINKYYYFGTPSDIFYRILDKFGLENGVTQTYRCNKQVIKNSPNFGEFQNPNPKYTSTESPVPPATSSGLKFKAKSGPGPHIDEKEFLK